MKQEIRQNFIYPDIPQSTYKFGANNFPDVVLNVTGDWRDFVPMEEYQNKDGIETSACYIYAQTHAIATIQEEQFNLHDQDYSDRFNALLSGGTLSGGDPLRGAESIRKIDGLIPDYMLSFNSYIKSWEEYHSFKGADEFTCRQAGKEFLNHWRLNYDIVFQREDSLELKFLKLKQALQYSPCPLSVYGVTDNNGNYIEKPQGANDTHMVLAVFVDEDNCIWVFDTYAPTLKKLPSMYNSDFCLRWSVSKLETVQVKKKTLWEKIKERLYKQRLIIRDFKKFWIKYQPYERNN
jgi:hypothetical protein